MTSCRVSYRDIEAVRHEVQVEADSLYEAVAKAVHVFRKTNWDGHPPGAGCEFTVEIRPDPPTRYTIALAKVEQHARYGAARGPRDILRKQQLRKLLGVDEEG